MKKVNTFIAEVVKAVLESSKANEISLEELEAYSEETSMQVHADVEQEDTKTTFGELTFEGRYNIPTLKITAGGRVGYLTPFRGYRFQVSGTRDGDGDYGSSPVMKYKELFGGMPRNITTGIIYSAAIEAVTEFCARNHSEAPYIASNSVFCKFIDESHKWIFGEGSSLLVD